MAASLCDGPVNPVKVARLPERYDDWAEARLPDGSPLDPFYGAKVVLDTTGLSLTIQGTITVTDRLGATASVAITPVRVEV